MNTITRLSTQKRIQGIIIVSVAPRTVAIEPNTMPILSEDRFVSLLQASGTHLTRYGLLPCLPFATLVHVALEWRQAKIVPSARLRRVNGALGTSGSVPRRRE